MKKIILFTIGLIMAGLCATAQETEKISITLKVNGIKEGKGQLMVGIYNSEIGYPDKGYKFVTIDLKKTNTNTVLIEDIVPDEYAIIVYQDLNENGDLDIGMRGPEEPLGYSNNASNPYGPAPFASAKMSFTKDTETSITLK
ncbi:DUF2141 domain-containing protein [Marinigracilibium pacificum]|uniref:DUF2141 domain-containing protein n=1 Tax=Marinigracilibium pacificum TaxID=2729599 RepID=A0A848IZ04_9BACT|nr:DUF2141 domain-containing protein [Marinigracilibium pacificum]NMM48581.1 DUF2141 domain-containing protein [Marinigracilibium pacificum]